MSETKTITGSVWKVREIPWSNKTLYALDIKEEDKDETPITIGLGEVKPTAEVGDRVQLSATLNEKKGRWNLTTKTSVKVRKGKGTKPPSDYGQRPSGGGGGQSSYDPNRQTLIKYQHAQNAAAVLLDTAVTQGILSLGTRKSDKLDNLLNQYRELTKEVFIDILDFEDALKKGIPARNVFDQEPKETPNQDENIQQPAPAEDFDSGAADDEGFTDEEEWEG